MDCYSPKILHKHFYRGQSDRPVGGGGIHHAEDIGDVKDMVPPFIMNGPGLINPQSGLLHLPEVVAIAGLIAQRPDNDAGMVFISLHHPDHPIYTGFRPAGGIVAGNPEAEPMSFKISLINDIDTVTVAKLIKTGAIGGVMTGADGIDIIGFDQLYIFFGYLQGNRMTIKRMEFMPIDPPLMRMGFPLTRKRPSRISILRKPKWQRRTSIASPEEPYRMRII